MENLKILCTGNPDDFTIARFIKQEFPDAVFLSRSNGFDLNMSENTNEQLFRNKIKDFNVFINSSWIDGNQTKVLEIVQQEWQNKKLCNVINIGSNAEFDGDNFRDKNYSRKKLALRESSLALNTKNFRTTHIILGGLESSTDTIDDYKIRLTDLVKTIKWILDCNVRIPLISIEP